MGMVILVLAALSVLIWGATLAAPWHAWWYGERVKPGAPQPLPAGALSVLIPARDEAHVIGSALRALRDAAPGAAVIVVDDQSTDGTADVARTSDVPNLTVVAGTPPPAGWSGKLWALQQALDHAATPRVLLLDADIRLAPGMLTSLLRKADSGCALVSVCAEPSWDTPAARWLMPAFVYFFKLLYPFSLANRADSRIAAAAGGVVLVDRAALRSTGAFGAWRDAIIDDCTLATHLKRAGFRCWIGVSHGATSLRRATLRDIVHMVARTAWVQLHESVSWLLAASALLIVAFWIPVLALAFGPVPATRALGLFGYLGMLACYLPTLMYYRRNPLAAVCLPVVATFYLVATWYSAWRALAGTRSVWKGRRYQRGQA